MHLNILLATYHSSKVKSGLRVTKRTMVYMLDGIESVANFFDKKRGV